MILGFDTETDKYGDIILIANSQYNYLFVPTKNQLLDYLMYFKNSINYFYNLKFDISVIIKLIIKNEINRDLLLTQWNKFKNIKINDYYISYIPHKIFSITKGGYLKKFTTKKGIFNRFVGFDRSTYFDIMQFYNTSLNKASVRYLNSNKINYDVNNIDYYLLSENKRIDLLKYCVQDCVLCRDLAILKTKIVNELIPIRKLISNASVAKEYEYKYLKKHKLLKYYTNKSIKKYNDIILLSYFGGRFETFMKGNFDNAYEYDINSCYPDIMSRLCQMTGKFEKNKKINNLDTSYDIIKIKLFPYQKYLSPLPFKMITRKKNYLCDNCFMATRNVQINTWLCHRCNLFKYVKGDLIYFPSLQQKLIKYITQYDIKMLDKMNIDYRVLEVYHFYHNNKILLGFIPELYKKRQKIKNNSDMKIHDNTIKKIYNSLYGVTMENIRGYEPISLNEWRNLNIHERAFSHNKKELTYLRKYNQKYGKMYEPLFGSLVTSFSRNKVIDNIIEYGLQDDLIQIATDSVLLKKKSNKFKLTSYLGDWKLKKLSDLCVFGNGLYYHNLGFKSRGFHCKTKEEFVQIIKNKYHSRQMPLSLNWKQKYKFDDLMSFRNVIKEIKFIDKKRIWEKHDIDDCFFKQIKSLAKII